MNRRTIYQEIESQVEEVQRQKELESEWQDAEPDGDTTFEPLEDTLPFTREGEQVASESGHTTIKIAVAPPSTRREGRR